MNDQTAQLLKDLASQMGTTAEYLWGVLVRQAPISGTIDLIITAVIFLVGIPLIYGLKKASAEREDSEGVWFIGMCIWGIILIIFIVNLPSALTAIMNPEYWALNKILSLCSPS